jgi:hypothetical protein
MSLVLRAREIQRNIKGYVGSAPAYGVGRASPLLDPADVLERAAILEFCEGLPRQQADARALSEAGFESWEELAIALGVSRV